MVVFSNDNIDSYVQVHSRTVGQAAAEPAGANTALIAGVVAAALALAAIVLLLRRRRRAEEQ